MTTENTTLVQKVLAEVLATGNVESLEAALSDDFLHHRPDSSRNKAEFLETVLAVPVADVQIDVQNVLGAGDHVVMHTLRRLRSTGLEIACVEIFRFENGLLTEAWEILETEAQAATNLLWWQPPGRRPGDF
ncbi:nuclear transport factor 2 family protein [Streptomyces sp. WMMC500]|uniref:nuclear transport factor 2 family protein n=1 Tax=Streptomyces sp. WMMC500 TaxID=3015154 RepID=UPI00248AA314|nr:nuclear transport factor 2 family protein [Streptomyces sp. WMMC500]WBB59592.1 nuclear transport factor 2 family protein [Streptomyces sp. WMMC500]